MSALRRSLFITGTDTDVGKTFVSALLVRALRAAGIDAVGMKPICCGDRIDAELLHEASEGAAELGEINPVWLRTPAAPYTAAMVEERTIDLALIRESFAKLRARHEVVIVEGAGGWLVPITADFFVADLAVEFALPVVVVAANKLGALNHTLLTVDSIAARGATCAGVIFNNTSDAAPDTATATNAGVLESILKVPMLAEIAHGQRTLQV